MIINWNFFGGGECKTLNLPWVEYGYFLELHNIIELQLLGGRMKQLGWRRCGLCIGLCVGLPIWRSVV